MPELAHCRLRPLPVFVLLAYYHNRDGAVNVGSALASDAVGVRGAWPAFTVASSIQGVVTPRPAYTWRFSSLASRCLSLPFYSSWVRLCCFCPPFDVDCVGIHAGFAKKPQQDRSASRGSLSTSNISIAFNTRSSNNRATKAQSE